jgi:hypothetical protein
LNFVTGSSYPVLWKGEELQAMTIEITRPEVEALIQQRLWSGVFSDAEDVIFHALRSSEIGHPTGAELVAAMQARRTGKPASSQCVIVCRCVMPLSNGVAT